ncbi:DB module domain-containing protein [Ditylenchus destructor]|nr:DB module domain-containing protein [Ditylenchus destructor]
MNPTFALSLFVFLAAFAGDIHAQYPCPCSPSCGQSLSCCECSAICYLIYYRCLKPCKEASCIVRCGEGVFKCAAKCLNSAFEICCQEKGVKIGLPCNYTVLQKHSSQDRSSYALSAGQDRSSYDYIQCMTRGKDNTQCCRDSGVSKECLDMCKPLDEHHNILPCIASASLEIFSTLARCSSAVQIPMP